MDQNLAQRRRGLEEKIPDIKKTLAMVEFLQDRRVSTLPLHLTRIIIPLFRKESLPQRTRMISTMIWKMMQMRESRSPPHSN